MRRTDTGDRVSYEDVDLAAERLEAYRTVALYARAYQQAVDAEDAVWEHAMRTELDTALLRARRLESRIQIEAGVA